MKTVGFLSMFYLTLLSFSSDVVVPHITQPESDFQTLIYFTNNSERTRNMRLVPYNTSGQQLSEKTLTLEPHQVDIANADDFFEVSGVSHFSYEDQGALRVSLGYRDRSSNGLTAHVTPLIHPNTAFTLPRSNPSKAFDSLALVNGGGQPTAVTISQHNMDGDVIAEVVASQNLAHMERKLVVLNTLFPGQEQGYYTVSATQPLYHIALKGTLQGAEKPALFQGFSEGNGGASSFWLPHITPQSSDFQTSLNLTNLGTEPRTVVLQPYQADGTAQEPQPVILASKSSMNLDLSSLSEGISHLALEEATGIQVRLDYARRDQQGISAFLTPPRLGKDFVFMQGDKNLTWDGFAITNPLGTTVALQIRYLDFGGVERGSVMLTLQAHQKQLFAPSQAFALQDAGYFRISADGPLALIALRGTQNSSVLFSNHPSSDSALRLTDKTIHDYNNGSQIVNLEGELLTLRLPDNTPPAIGSIIVGNSSFPFLREVRGISNMGNDTYLAETVIVPITDVVKDGTLIASAESDVIQQKLGIESWDADFNAQSLLSASASGEIVIDLMPRLESRFANSTQEHFWFGVDGSLKIDLSGELRGNLQGSAEFTKEGLINRTLFASVTYIGIPILVAWVLEVDAIAEFTGTAEGSVRWASSAEYTSSIGLNFDIVPELRLEPTHQVLTPHFEPLSQVVEISGNVKATIHLIPKIHARLMGIAGPYLGMDAFVQADFDILENSYDFGLGLKGFAGGELNPLFFGDGHSVEAQLFDNFWPLASGSFAPVGYLSGAVRGASSNTGLQGVYVAINKPGQVRPVQVQYTDDLGQFLITLPAGETHQVEFAKAGFISETYNALVVTEGQVTHLEPVLQVALSDSGQGNAAGRIINAVNGDGLENLFLEVRAGLNNTTGLVLATATTNGSGYYLLSDLQAGNCTVAVSGDGYQPTSFSILILGNQTVEDQNSTVTPALNEGEVRIILTWGEAPSDLDSYLTGPSGSDRFTLYYGNRTYDDAQTSANLDRDDISRYGPETVTLTRQGSGAYRYYVRNYSDGGDDSSSRLSSSGAKVQVVRANAQDMVFHVPSNRVGTVWSVFEMTDGVIQPTNIMGGDALVTKRNSGDRLPMKDKTNSW